MRNIVAHKTRYSFADTPEKAERYRVFLKEHILELSPKYYGITDKQKVLTPDGVMYAVKLVPELDDPAYEIIAECWVNNVHIYLWRDRCWMAAVDKNKRLIVDAKWSQAGTLFHLDEQPLSKTMIIFQIGEPCVVMQP